MLTIAVDGFSILLYLILFQGLVSSIMQSRRFGSHFFSERARCLHVAIMSQELSDQLL
jgi:hypothetical protein